MDEPKTEYQEWQGYETIDEIAAFDQGYKAGLTAYARERNEPTSKRRNELLARLMDEQSHRTAEELRAIAISDMGRPAAIDSLQLANAELAADAARWKHVLEHHCRAGSPHMDNTWAYCFAGALRGRWETPEQAVDAARREANGL